MQKQRKLEREADSLCREHLRDRLLIAERRGDEAKGKAIRQIITNKRIKNDWRRIKFGIGKPVAGATTKIQKVIDGETVDITEPEVMNREIQESSWRTALRSNKPP